MDKNILARNLLILNQLENISSELLKRSLHVCVLKGAALMLAFPDYAKERLMEDIDMLVRPSELSEVRKLFLSMNYTPVNGDPCAMKNPSAIAPVDIIDNIWYLDADENKQLFDEAKAFRLAKPFSAFFHLKLEDFYIHVLAHGALHHAEDNIVWKKDLSLIWEKWGKTIRFAEIEAKLKQYGFQRAVDTYMSPDLAEDSFYRRLLNSENNPYKGHIARFIFLPSKKKVRYLYSSLFPAKDFLKNRYNLKNGTEVFYYRLLRPFLFFSNLAGFALRTFLQRKPR